MSKNKIGVAQLIVFLLMPFMLSWPSWFNGQPFFFPDTSAYIKGAASATELIFPSRLAKEWLSSGTTSHVISDTPSLSNGRTDAANATDTINTTVANPPAAGAADRYTSSPEKNGVLAGRSVYYGLFVLLISMIFGLKFVPVFQALLVITVIASVLRARFALSYTTLGWSLALLAVASPLPYFASFLMPDVFAAPGIVCLLALLLIPAGWGQKTFWALMVLAALLFHTGNILIFAGILVSVVILKWLFGPRISVPGKNIALICVLIAAGIAGEIAFGMAVKHVTGSSPIRPPFVTARLLADGPGNDYLNQHCPQAEFEVCEYRRDFTKASSDDFLWSTDPATGVFTLASKQSREKLSAEDSAFAKKVFLADPVRVITSSVKNVLAELKDVGLEEFVYDPQTLNTVTHKIPVAEANNLLQSRAAQRHFDVHYLEVLNKIAAALGAIICLAGIVVLFRKKRISDAVLLLTVCLSMLVNAVVCGALSTPHDRYQARIIWLLELIAVLLCLALRHTVNNQIPHQARQA